MHLITEATALISAWANEIFDKQYLMNRYNHQWVQGNIQGVD